jgi:hypothetical protein
MTEAKVKTDNKLRGNLNVMQVSSKGMVLSVIPFIVALHNANNKRVLIREDQFIQNQVKYKQMQMILL